MLEGVAIIRDIIVVIVGVSKEIITCSDYITGG
jgi:hypothetical protein